MKKADQILSMTSLIDEGIEGEISKLARNANGEIAKQTIETIAEAHNYSLTSCVVQIMYGMIKIIEDISEMEDEPNHEEAKELFPFLKEIWKYYR